MKIKGGVLDTKLICCPVCYADSCTVSGFDSDGRTLTIHFVCTCGAMFVYEYVRQGGDTVFMCKVVQVNAESLR